MQIIDSYNRTFKTLRVSLTNSCNLACTYCVNEDVTQPIAKRPVLSSDQLVRIIELLHQLLGLKTIRLTGGEPTLYHDLVPLVKQLQHLHIPIKITTNGFLLKKFVNEIAPDQIDTINVSLDALDEDIFFQISKRRSVHKIIEGIDAATAKGIKVKLNCVMIKGLNESQFLPLLAFAERKGIVIRFLELMRMGHIHEDNTSQFYAQDQLLELISTHTSFVPIQRQTGSTANYWQTATGQVFGIIANESSPFCGDCDRLRLDSYGTIYGCLSEHKGLSINDIRNTQELTQLLQTALLQKQPVKFVGSKLSMIEVGG